MEILDCRLVLSCLGVLLLRNIVWMFGLRMVVLVGFL